MSDSSNTLKGKLYKQAKDQLQSTLTDWVNTKLPSASAKTPDFTAHLADYFGQMIDSDDALKNGAIYDASGEAQFMRFTAGASASEKPDSKDWLKKKMGLGQVSANVEFDVVNATLETTMEWPGEEGHALTFHYIVAEKGAAKETTKSYDAGHVKLICKPSLDASVGASCALSAGLRLAVNADGSCGMKGTTPVNTDFLSQNFAGKSVAVIHNDYNDDGTVKEAATPSESASGITASVDLFAGVKAGGSGSVVAQWKGPDSGAKWVELFNGSLQGAVALGVGVKGDFIVTLHEGRLVIVLGLTTAFGPGFQGKAGGAVDGENINAFVKVVLKMVAQSGFRRVLFINSEKNGSEAHNDAFKYLNELLTAVFTSSMDIALLATLSLKQLEDINQQMLAKEYAPVLTRNINKSTAEKTNAHWFDDTLPEVKGRLLWCLMQLEESFAYSWESLFTKTLEQSAAQRDAVLNLIQWISRESDEAGSRQYEEMLTRCNSGGTKSDDEFTAKQAYVDTWIELLSWFHSLKQHKPDLNRSALLRVNDCLQLLIDRHHQLCPELNKQYHLYEYRREGYFRNPQDAWSTRWIYAGPLKPALSMDERLQKLGILPGAKVIKEGL